MVLQSFPHYLMFLSFFRLHNEGLYASVASIQLLPHSKAIDKIDESFIYPNNDRTVNAVDSVGWTGFEPLFEPFTVMLDDPKKFTILMDKEQFLYDLAQRKQEALLHAWSIRQSTGNDILEAPMMKRLLGSNEGQSNGQGGVVLMKHKQIHDKKEKRDENNDSDNDSDNNSVQDDDVEEDEETGENNG